MASIYDHADCREVFGDLPVGRDVLDAFDRSALCKALLGEYRVAALAGQMRPMSLRHPRAGVDWFAVPGVPACFVDQTGRRPGGIHVNPQALAQGKAAAACLIVVQLVRFFFRPSVHLDAGGAHSSLAHFRDRQFEVEILTDRAAWEWAGAGFDCSDAAAAGMHPGFDAARYQSAVDEARREDPQAGDARIFEAALAMRRAHETTFALEF